MAKKRVGKRSADSPPKWYPKGKCYRKRLTIDGQQREFTYRYPHNAAGARQAAQEWLCELSRIRAGTELANLQNKAQSILRVLASHPEYDKEYSQSWHHAAQQMRNGISEIEAQRRGISLIYAGRAMRDMHIEDAHRLLSDAVGQRVETEVPEHSETLKDVLTLYLADQQRQCELGEISKSRHYTIRRWAERLIETKFGSRAIPTTEEEFGRLLIDYRSYCDQELASGVYGKSSFDYRMQEVRKFAGWASGNYHFPHLPRNIQQATKKFGKGSVNDPAKAIPIDVLESIAEQSFGWLACCIAMSLNCGFYSVDYGSIRAEDIGGGYLTFTRQKTKKKANNGKGVTVVYKLWNETRELVERYGNKDGLLITDANGKPVHEETSSRANDRVYLAAKPIFPGEYSYRNLRDTGASMIEQIDRRWTDSYLAHADRRIARMYIDGNADQKEIFQGLHDATDEMRTRLLPVLQKLVP